MELNNYPNVLVIKSDSLFITSVSNLHPFVLILS